MIKESKFIKYLLYAFGEIVLLVIGILIALYINNQNGERLKKEKLDAIYIEVQRELAQNIERTTTAIDFFEKKDSIVYLILNNKLTKEDYIKKPILAFAIANNTSIYIQSKGYLSLTENLDILPTSFNPIIKKLNVVYERNNSALVEAQENFSLFMLENVKNMSETKSWFYEFGYKRKLNDEILEYFVNDPFYKNKVFEYQIYYHNLSLQVVKLDAVKAYKALSEITGIKDGIDASIYFQTDEELSKYVGKFKIKSNDVLFNKEKGYNVITFKVVDGQLYAILFGKREIEIFPHAKNIFILGNGDNAKFSFIQNENGQITGFQLFNNSVYTDWARVK